MKSFYRYYDASKVAETLFVTTISFARNSSIIDEIGVSSPHESFIQTTISSSTSDERVAVIPSGLAFLRASFFAVSQTARSFFSSRRHPRMSLRRAVASGPRSLG